MISMRGYRVFIHLNLIILVWEASTHGMGENILWLSMEGV